LALVCGQITAAGQPLGAGGLRHSRFRLQILVWAVFLSQLHSTYAMVHYVSEDECEPETHKKTFEKDDQFALPTSAKPAFK